MARVNVSKKNPIYTHEGAKAQHLNPLLQLRRSVLSCMLWENTFYENGKSIADRIGDLVLQVDATKVQEIAIEAREKQKLRHAPLWLMRALARRKGVRFQDTLARIIQRADELTEFVALYWKDGKQPLSAQVKKGLAQAFTKFNAYQLAKYNRDGAIKLKDVLFLCHAKPKDKEQEEIWKRLIDGTLAPPDTWEVNLSGGKNKKETFERLINENKLGSLALLRNLRNMTEAKVDSDLIRKALFDMDVKRVLPFRFITAARYNPNLEANLESALFKCLQERGPLLGKTLLLVDVSASMDWRLSDKSEVTRFDAAAGIAMILREMCQELEVFTFSNRCVLCPPRRGFALRDALSNSQDHSGTWLGNAIKVMGNAKGDRLIVITDEQSHDNVPSPHIKSSYIINVAPYRNGIGYGPWTHIDGFSENVIDYIQELEHLYADQV